MTKWIRIDQELPAFGQRIIGLYPVNIGSPSQHWIPEPLVRLNVEMAQELYDADFDSYEVEDWYAPLDDIKSDSPAPWLWTPFEMPEEKPSEAFPDGPTWFKKIA